MPSLFKRKKAEPTPFTTTPGLPGTAGAGQQLIDKLTGWLASPETMPGWNLAAGTVPSGLTGQALARRGEMLDPSFLTGEWPALKQLAGVWTTQQRADEADIMRDLIMRGASVGQSTLSTPTMDRLARAGLESRQGLAERISQAQLASLGQRLGLQSAVSSEELGRSMALSESMQQRLAQIIQAILSYTLGGREQRGATAGGYSASPFESILGSVLPAFGQKWAGTSGTSGT